MNKPTTTEIGYLKYWCSHGMTPLEMQKLEIENNADSMIQYLENAIKRYRNKRYISNSEYLSMKKELFFLMTSLKMIEVKRELPKENRSYSISMNNPDNENTSI
jgi:hypothetical protein